MDPDAADTFDAAYRTLPDRAQEIYRLFGILPGADIAAITVAELVGTTLADALWWLRSLVDAELLEQRSEQWFGMHDRLRTHASTTAAAALTSEGLNDERRRVVAGYRKIAADAARAVIDQWHIGDDFHRPIRVNFTRESGLDWLEEGMDSLLAIQHMAVDLGMFTTACDLVEAGWPLFRDRKHPRWWQRYAEVGFHAATACGDGIRLARMHQALGAYHHFHREWIRAEEHFRSALYYAQDADHLPAEATSHEGIGICQHHQGHHERAIASFNRAAGLLWVMKRPRGVRLQLRHRAEPESAAGRPDEALATLAEAHKYPFGPDEGHLESRELLAEAGAYRAIGDLTRATTILTRHQTLARQLGEEFEEANSELALADIARERDDHDQEIGHLTAAYVIYKRLGAPQAEELHERLQRLQPHRRDK